MNSILSIDLFSMYVLFSQYSSCDNTLENCFFQISCYSRAYVRIIYEKTKGQVSLGPLLGKQNIQAKEVYWVHRGDLGGRPTRSSGKLATKWHGLQETAQYSKEIAIFTELKARLDDEKAVIYKASSHSWTVCDYPMTTSVLKLSLLKSGKRKNWLILDVRTC